MRGGGGGRQSLVGTATAIAHGAQLNFDDLTPHMQPM
jgi:hypothetical protein